MPLEPQQYTELIEYLNHSKSSYKIEYRYNTIDRINVFQIKINATLRTDYCIII